MRRAPAIGSPRAGDRAVAGEQDFAPIAIVDVELSEPIAEITATDVDGRRYGGARVLVRLHSKPLGMFDLPIGEQQSVTAAACAAAVWDAMGPKIKAHLRADGLPVAESLDPRGLLWPGSPPCLRRREALLCEAPAASVIVCTRNRADLLARSLRSLESLEYPDVELIVVDGSSSTETADLVRGEFPRVRFSTSEATG